MSFVANESQQLSLTDSFNTLSPRTKRVVENSWAKGFAEVVFPAINEERFSVLYSSDKANRPNTPANAVISSLILKEMFDLTDDELLESILCDVRFQYALHTTSCDEQPFSDRTFSRFRERLYDYCEQHKRDLLQEEMRDIAQVFCQYLKLQQGMKRMDSLMVSANSKKMSRLEIVYTCVANMIKAIHRTGEDALITGGLERYLDPDDCNRTIYHRKNEGLEDRLTQTLQDAQTLLNSMDAAYAALPEYTLLKRVVNEQAEPDGKDSVKPRENSAISPSSLQNPSDPDATYRKKAGKDHKGYVGNLVETFDDRHAIITDYDYAQNTHSDSDFCKQTIEQLGKCEEKTTLIADGAYASAENVERAANNNIELVTTALIGKLPDEVLAEFKLDEDSHEVLSCPLGKCPYKVKFNASTGFYRVSFHKCDCEHCPLREKCRAKIQKKSAVVMISAKMVQRANYLKTLSTQEYKRLSRKRNGVEALPSLLRRKYGVDHMPVRGFVRSKIWFGFKVWAINAKRVLAAAKREGCFSNAYILFLFVERFMRVWYLLGSVGWRKGRVVAR